MRIEFEGTKEEFDALFGFGPADVPTFFTEDPEPTPTEKPVPAAEPKPKKKKKDDWVAEGMAKVDALVEAGKSEVVKAALAQYEVKKLQEIKVADFPAFMELLNG